MTKLAELLLPHAGEYAWDSGTRKYKVHDAVCYCEGCVSGEGNNARLVKWEFDEARFAAREETQ